MSFLNIRRDATTCIDCGRCDKACMMNIEVATADVVTSSECISCNECVNVCPVPGALKVTAPGGSRATVLAATGIVVARHGRHRRRHHAQRLVRLAHGEPRRGPRRRPARAGRRAGIGQGQGEGQGEGEGHGGGGSDSPIKGWMSLADIAAMTGIPLADFGAGWGVPAADLGLPMKDIKDTYGFSPEDVRAWVEDRLAE